MSLERFSEHNPEISGGLGITQLADELISYCRESLLIKGKNYPATLTLDDEQEYWSNTVNEHAGVWVGNLFIEIEQSMEKGAFDFKGFIDKTRHDLSGTPLSSKKITLPDKYHGLIEIDHDNLTRMSAIRNEDKTYVRFLTEKGVLPFEVEDYLTKELGLLDSTPLRYVLKVWESRAGRDLNATTTALQKTEDASILPQPFRKPSAGSESNQTGLSEEEKNRLIKILKGKEMDEGWTWKKNPQDN